MFAKYFLIFVALPLFAQCNENTLDERVIIPNPDDSLLIPYFIRMGNDVLYRANPDVKVSEGSNFYSVMEKAAKNEPALFDFEATVHPEFGHYITSVGGFSENKDTNTYWMIYITDYPPYLNFPEPTDKDLSQFGVDSLLVKKGLYYLFWLKHVDLH